MMLEAGGIVRTGRTIDARNVPVDGATVAAAIRGQRTPITVESPAPSPVHERVGYVRPEMGVSVRTALAAAARSRELSAPQDDDIAARRAELADIEVPEIATDTVRREFAAADTETERLEERVAELRGRVQVLRERGTDEAVAEAEAALTSAVRELSEVATDRTAASQRLDRDRLKKARDARERRLRLEDEVANLERAARASLAAELREAYAAAVADTPGPSSSDPFEADPVTAALAIGHVADLRAPVVLACDRFRAPAAAASWLDAPVVRV